MAESTIKELRDKKDVELDRMLSELRAELQGFRFKSSAKQLKAVREIRKVRKEIARILTLKKERQLSQKANA